MMGCRDYETVANARVDALAALPVSSVVLDGRRVAWQRTFTNSWRSTMDHEVYTSELDRRYGPVTVLYDPRGGDFATGQDSAATRAPTCHVTAPVSTASAVHTLLWNLADLPDTDAIAAHLHGQGARGRRGESGCCPVSDYVWRSLGVRVLVCPVFWMGDADAQVIPGRVGEFVSRFDRGLYPELDLEAER